MNQLHSISIQPDDIEKQIEHVLDGYAFASENGFPIGKDIGKVVEVVEIQGYQFRRHLPAIPPHSHESFSYQTVDPENFECCKYQDHILFLGALEEERVLELRLSTFRKEANELKELAKGMSDSLHHLNELTNAGDLASCFQYQEQINKQSIKASAITRSLALSQESNLLLKNTLEYKMKAAGDIAEYEQAQNIKVILENYSNLQKEISTLPSPIPPEKIISFSNALEIALQQSNYLTD